MSALNAPYFSITSVSMAWYKYCENPWRSTPWFSYNSCSNKAIDLYGIKTANEKVLKDSINDLFISKDLVYVDHFKIDKFNAVSVIKGEDNCLPIALASIVAKVLRDEFMKNLPEKYKLYNLNQNKGYGTKEHRDAIKKYGITDLHRKSFSLMPK